MESISYLPITIQPTKTFQENQYMINASSSLLHYWGIRTSEPIHLCIGTKEIEVTCIEKEIDKDRMMVSEQLLEELPLPVKEYRFLSYFDKSRKKLLVGPIVALMTELRELEDGKPDFRSVHTFCEELHDTSQIGGGLLYICPLKDFSADRVKGWYYREDGWEKGNFIPPNVIYNRIHSRKLEASSFFDHFKKQTSLAQIPYFNEQFLSKWDVHQLLHGEKQLQPFLPHTEKFTKEGLITFFTKDKKVFIKPINGSQGRFIYKVSHSAGIVVVETSTSGKMNDFLIDDFLAWFTNKHRPSAFIIQEAIPLIQHQNKQLDFRVLCHKNYQDRWKVTSLVARASAPDQFVSNLARGGELLKPVQALSGQFEQERIPTLIQQMKELALDAAHTISGSQLGLVGELGIDMCIDIDGKPWIIEANSKPSKNIEEQQEKIRPSAKAIFEYATALAFGQLRRQEQGED